MADAKITCVHAFQSGPAQDIVLPEAGSASVFMIGKGCSPVKYALHVDGPRFNPRHLQVVAVQKKRAGDDARKQYRRQESGQSFPCGRLAESFVRRHKFPITT